MKKWYLLYCKRGEQLRAKQHLENQGVECFYPTIEVEKILRGKRQIKNEPLFPSYIFVRFDFELGPTFTTVRSTRGVVDFVKFGAHPKELESDLIDELKLLEQEGHQTKSLASNLPKPGETIKVKSGQFAGIEAIFQEQDGETRSIMLVKMISQTVPVSIENSDLEFNG